MRSHFYLLVTIASGLVGCQAENAKTATSTATSIAVLKPFVPKYHFASISQHDIMTQADQFLCYYVHQDLSGNSPLDWPLIKDLVKIFKEIKDADITVDLLGNAIPASNQVELKYVHDILDDCCKLLSVHKPKLWIQGTPNVQAFVTKLQEPHYLVITSGLLELYAGRPEELRFIIGHEIGHLKCRHIKAHSIGNLLIQAVVKIAERYSEKLAQFIMPTTFVTYLKWLRESEYSADRAGLVCVGGDVEIAKSALQRLLHHTKLGIDTGNVIKEQLAFEQMPFVQVIKYLKEHAQTHPFIYDRCIALDQWTMETAFINLSKAKKQGGETNKLLAIDSIEILGIPDFVTYGFGDVGIRHTCNPIVRFMYNGEIYDTHKLDKEANPKYVFTDLSFTQLRNCILHLEVWDYSTVFANRLVGAVAIEFDEVSGTAKTNLRLDVREENKSISLPTVEVKYRIVNKQDSSK